MPPLNQNLPQLVVEALRNARVYSTIDLLSAERGTLLRVFEAEDIRQSLLQFWSTKVKITCPQKMWVLAITPHLELLM